MRFGIAFNHSNYNDWDRFMAMERGEDVGPMAKSDYEVLSEQFALADLVEPLGFDSLWTFEMHASPGLMNPDPTLYLAHYAGRTKRIDFGSMITVLPWHNPVRLAEQITMLQYFMGPKRKYRLGVGRGLALRNFESMGVSMDDATDRFNEVLEVLRLCFTEEMFSFHGKFFDYDNVSMRPRPLNSETVVEAWGSWTSERSVRNMGARGLNPLTSTNITLESYLHDLDLLNEIRAENGFGPAQRPVLQLPIHCGADEQKAHEDARRYMTEWVDSVMRLYEIGTDRWANAKGYEQYKTSGSDFGSGSYDDAVEKLTNKFLDVGLVGSADQCVEKLMYHIETINPSEIVVVSGPGSINGAESEKVMRLYAEKVVPRVREYLRSESAEPVAVDRSAIDDEERLMTETVAGCPVLQGYDPLRAQELSDPFPSYERARHDAPVFFSEQYGFWSVSRRADVLAILRDTERFSNKMAIPMPLPPERIRDRLPKYPFATALLFLDDPEHAPARRMVQAPFTPKRLRDLEPLTRARAEELLRLDDGDRRLEFVRGYATPLALVVIGKIIGVPKEDFPLLEKSIYGAFRIGSGVASAEEIDQLADGQLEYWEYLKALVDERRARPLDDFSSVLAGYAKEDGTKPSSDEVAGHINTILGAGFETSAQLMSLGVQAILSHRDQWELLKSDRSLLPSAVEECARYRTVIKRNFRVALTDVEVDGVKIPEGSLIAILMACTNRDESAFPDPDRFDITRKVDNLTFGRGMHYCLGAPLSKLELRLTLDTLLDWAPDAKLVEDQQYEYKNDLRLDGLEHLYIDLGPVPPR